MYKALGNSMAVNVMRWIGQRIAQVDAMQAIDEAAAWPVATEASWSTYRSDSAVHATYWIASWPRTDETSMWRTVKSADVWLGSMVQVPSRRGQCSCDPVRGSTSISKTQKSRPITDTDTLVETHDADMALYHDTFVVGQITADDGTTIYTLSSDPAQAQNQAASLTTRMLAFICTEPSKLGGVNSPSLR